MKRFGQMGLILLFIFLGVKMVFLVLGEWEGKPIPMHIVNSQGKEIRESLTDVHMMETRHDGKAWELWADKSFRYRGEEKFHLRGIRAVFPMRKGVSFTVTGQVGAVNMNLMDMEVSGNVVTQSTNGYIFKTKSLSYVSSRRFLESPAPIEMTFPRDRKGFPMTLKGSKMVADLNTSLIEIQGEVVMKKSLGEKGTLTVGSERVRLSGQSNRAQFLGNVVMTMGFIKVVGPEAEFEYEKETNLISRVFLKGGVRGNDRTQDRWVTSEEVEVFLADERFTFRGNPIAVQDNHELRGETIILQGNKFLKVDKVRAKVDKDSVEEVH